MEIRTTTLTTMNRILAATRQQSDRMAALQTQAATGKRIQQASDDPLGMISVLANRATDGRLGAYLTNITTARTTLEASNNALRDANDILVQARTIAQDGANATNDGTSNEALAQQVDALLGRLLEVANTRGADGRYLFGGTADGSAPFTVAAADPQGRPTAISYAGAAERGGVAVSGSLTVATLYTGAEAFQPRQRGATVYAGATGAAAGTGTDSATGRGTLTVRHTATTYAAGSGVKPGTDSAAGDTVLGPSGSHRLTFAAGGTVSLDGGPEVAFGATDTNLKVTGANGAVVYLDTTAVTPGFTGAVDAAGAGTLSTDGGATEVPIDFSANQVVTDSRTGAVTNVNTSNVRAAGTEALDYQGTADAFQALIALRDELRNTAKLSPAQQNEALSRRMADIDRVRENALGVVGDQAASLQNLDALESRTQDVQLQVQKLATDKEGADVSEVVIHLQEQQNQLQLTLASAARMFDINLLDFLR